MEASASLKLDLETSYVGKHATLPKFPLLDQHEFLTRVQFTRVCPMSLSLHKRQAHPIHIMD